MTISFKDLEGDFERECAQPAHSTSTDRQTFPCDKCGGTGIYTWGYVNQRSGKCHACGGKGHFLTSRADRNKAKAFRQKREANKLADNMAATMEQHGDLIKWLSDNVSWNDFARSLVDQFGKRGTLSDNQIAAATRMMNKTEATRAAKTEVRNSNAVEVELAKINKMFATAKANGLKKPALRIGDITISIAPANGKNAGCLYVKDSGEYAGKITAVGEFFKVRAAREAIKGELQALALDPKGKAIEHGRKTGNCSCCGRELTNHESIQLGIGPICASKWGW